MRGSLPPPSGGGSRSVFSRLESPAPYLRLAIFLVQLGQGELGEPFIADALRAWPKAQGAHGTLAQIHEGRGEVASAIREYEAERALVPDEPFINRQLGLLYFKAAGPRAGAAAGRGDRFERRARVGGTGGAERGGEAAAEAVACARRAVEAAPGKRLSANLGWLLSVTGSKRSGRGPRSVRATDARDPSILRPRRPHLPAWRDGPGARLRGASSPRAGGRGDQTVQRTIGEKVSPASEARVAPRLMRRPSRPRSGSPSAAGSPRRGGAEPSSAVSDDGVVLVGDERFDVALGTPADVAGSRGMIQSELAVPAHIDEVKLTAVESGLDPAACTVMRPFD
jgi:hypothetical protein